MKKVILLIVLNFSFANAQTTGFLQNFDDGKITGWNTHNGRTFKLSIDSTSLKITYTRTAASDEWDSFRLTLPAEVDVSNTPEIYVRAKASIPVMLVLKPTPAYPSDVLSNMVVDDGEWHDLFFQITNTRNFKVDAVVFHFDGGYIEDRVNIQRFGTVWIDEIRIGDSILTLPVRFNILEEAIASANALLNSSVEGSGEGEYPAGSKAELQNQISEASLFLGKNDALQSEVDSVTAQLYDACSTFESLVNTQPVTIIDKKANKQTRYLYLNLKNQMNRSLLYGMHDATGYGASWYLDDDHSDIKDVCGDFPSIYSEDLNKIATGKEVDRVRYRITSAYNRGGVITMCWHQFDPNGGFSWWEWNKNKEKVVHQILPGGSSHSEYLLKLERVAKFFKSLRGDNGEAIPIIFRPYHEHTGNWFWWGIDRCTTEEYNQLWQFTVDYLHKNLNVHNLLWAISPMLDHVDKDDEYFERFPGNDYVDIYGFDYYRHEPLTSNAVSNYTSGLNTVVKHALDNDKIPALTEVGQEGLSNIDFHTRMLINPIKHDSINNSIAYAATWRNRDLIHHHAPYPGHPSAPDFIEFYNDPYTLFESDLPDMYMYSIPEEDTLAPLFTSYPHEQLFSFTSSVEIEVETNEMAFLRWSYNDEDYDMMPHQFEFGERAYIHTTFIEAEQGKENSIYVRAKDIYGNKTEKSIHISFTVDTLQALIDWYDPRYPISDWSNGAASFGSGSDAATSINEVQTAYFIKDFELSGKPNGARITIQLNGGLAVYVNGFEAVRYYLPEEIVLDYNTPPLSTSRSTKSVNLDSEMLDKLKAGTNKIAVEIHGGSKSVELFDALFQTDIELPFYYGSDWRYYDLGDMPKTYTLGEITGVNLADNLVPKKIKLYQNYPNPFNPTTTLKYELPKTSEVSLVIYNLLGNKVKTLVYSQKDAGNYSIKWDGKNDAGLSVPSGVYFCKMKAQDFTQTQKMMLLK